MATTYTQDENKSVVEALMTTGLAIAMADFGIVSTAIESAALAKELTGAANNYPNNSIIQSVLTPDVLKQTPMQPPKDITPDNVLDVAITKLNGVVDMLGSKATPAEVTEFKSFVYQCAERVANAAGEGLFGSGEKVSAKETAALNKLKAALGI
jgi:hypothetical protein